MAALDYQEHKIQLSAGLHCGSREDLTDLLSSGLESSLSHSPTFTTAERPMSHSPNTTGEITEDITTAVIMDGGSSLPQSHSQQRHLDDNWAVVTNEECSPCTSSSSVSQKVNRVQLCSSDEERGEARSTPNSIQHRNSGSSFLPASLQVSETSKSRSWSLAASRPEERRHRRSRGAGLRSNGDNNNICEIPTSDDDEGNPLDGVREAASDVSARRYSLHRHLRRDFCAGRSVAAALRRPSVTPVRWLSMLFLISCYTTFWLPYPELQPSSPPPDVVAFVIPKWNQTTTIGPPLAGAGTGHVIQFSSSSSQHLFARASPESVVEFTYAKPASAPSDRNYDKEGFPSNSWTNYLNLGALGTVLMWYVHRTRTLRPNESPPADVVISRSLLLLL